MARYAEAEAPLVAAWETSRSQPALQAQVATVARRLVALYEAWGQPDRAEPYRAAARTSR
jgi:hypothetical protein